MPPGTSPWAFHPHPEVYLEVIGLAAAYWAALRLLGPRFVEPGEPPAKHSFWPRVAAGSPGSTKRGPKRRSAAQ